MFTLGKRLCLLILAGLFISPGCTLRKTKVLERLPAPVIHVGTARSSQGRGAHEFAKRPSDRTTDRDTRIDRSIYSDIPASWYPRGRERAWKAIVIHHSAGNNGCAEAFDKAHRARGWDELGYHFVIGNGSGSPDGFVEIGPRWRKQKHGAHCRTPGNFYNERGIGICLVGNFDQSYPTSRQMASLRKLVLFLMHRYNISPQHVYGHGELKSTRCPGRHLSMGQLRDWLKRTSEIYASSR